MSLYRDLEKIADKLRTEGFDEIADELDDIAWNVEELEDNSDDLKELEKEITELEKKVWELEDNMVIKPTTLYEQDKAEIVEELYNNFKLFELQQLRDYARNNKS
tara:strand:- start:219 stop:533 length:315 start_codon:yes stop_codon:yes gene_type:complete